VQDEVERTGNGGGPAVHDMRVEHGRAQVSMPEQFLGWFTHRIPGASDRGRDAAIEDGTLGGIVKAGDSLYWSNFDDGTVWRIGL
jgi:hypothetical protein